MPAHKKWLPDHQHFQRQITFSAGSPGFKSFIVRMN
jgi:hypothetical protein